MSRLGCLNILVSQFRIFFLAQVLDLDENRKVRRMKRKYKSEADLTLWGVSSLVLMVLGAIGMRAEEIEI